MTSPQLTMNISDIIKAGQHIQVDISKIKVPPYHDRTDVDDDNIESLANNMSEMGQLTPILVEKVSEGEFDLISGLRRYEAGLKLNWGSIDAIVLENLDEQSKILIMIAENSQRESINDYDLVVSLVHLLAVSTGKTDDDIKAFILKMRNHDAGNVKNLAYDEKQLRKNIEITLTKTDKYALKNVINKIRVLDFNPVIIKAMQDHKLTFYYGKLLNKVKDETALNNILTLYISKQLSKADFLKEIRKATVVDKPVVLPFNATLKKLKDYSKLPQDKQNFIVAKMQEIDAQLAS